MPEWDTDIHEGKVWSYHYNDIAVSLNHNGGGEASIKAYTYPDGTFQNSFTSEELRTLITMLQEAAEELENE